MSRCIEWGLESQVLTFFEAWRLAQQRHQFVNVASFLSPIQIGFLTLWRIPDFVNVKCVKGPATFAFEGSNAMGMTEGELTAIITKQSTGFIVSTPTATVRDIGTEFGVRVEKNGEGFVQVFKGVVELESASINGEQKIHIKSSSAPLTLAGLPVPPVALETHFFVRERSIDSSGELPNWEIELHAASAKITGELLSFRSETNTLSNC